MSTNLISYGVVEKFGFKFRGGNLLFQFTKTWGGDIRKIITKGSITFKCSVTKAEVKVPREKKVSKMK